MRQQRRHEYIIPTSCFSLTWHSYVPLSLFCTYFIFNIQSSEPSACNTVNLSSFVYVNMPEVKMCQSLRRTHDIWNHSQMYIILMQFHSWIWWNDTHTDRRRHRCIVKPRQVWSGAVGYGRAPWSWYTRQWKYCITNAIMRLTN